MAFPTGDDLIANRRGLNGYWYALAAKLAVAAGEDPADLDSYLPICDGDPQEENFKREALQLIVSLLQSGFSLSCVPDLCAGDDFECECPESLRGEFIP